VARGLAQLAPGLAVQLVRVAYQHDQAISTTRLSALQTSFSPMERGAMLRAAVKIVNFFRERAPSWRRRTD
jgi:hypothetical protein